VSAGLLVLGVLLLAARQVVGHNAYPGVFPLSDVAFAALGLVPILPLAGAVWLVGSGRDGWAVWVTVLTVALTAGEALIVLVTFPQDPCAFVFNRSCTSPDYGVERTFTQAATLAVTAGGLAQIALLLVLLWPQVRRDLARVRHRGGSQ
jgi:hypothetical protein